MNNKNKDVSSRMNDKLLNEKCDTYFLPPNTLVDTNILII